MQFIQGFLGRYNLYNPLFRRSYANEPQRSVLDFCITFQVGPVLTLTSFEFSESGQPPLNTDWQSKPKPTKLPPRYRHAHSFWILSWNSASTTAFSSTMLFHRFVQVFDTLKNQVNCFETRDTSWAFCKHFFWAFCKHYDFPEHFASTFSFLCHFHMNSYIQNSWPHWSSTYRWQWQFSTGNCFHGKD